MLKWSNISDTRRFSVYWDLVLRLPNGNVHPQVEPFQVGGADLVRQQSIGHLAPVSLIPTFQSCAVHQKVGRLSPYLTHQVCES